MLKFRTCVWNVEAKQMMQVLLFQISPAVQLKVEDESISLKIWIQHRYMKSSWAKWADLKHFTLLCRRLLYLSHKYVNSLTIVFLISEEVCTIKWHKGCWNTLIAFKGPSVFLVSCRIVTRSESQKYCCLLPKKFCKQGFPRHRADWLHPTGRIYSLVCLLLGACGGEGGSYLTKELKIVVLFTL